MFVAPPGYQPIYNPCIPYLGPIGAGMREGMSLYIHGTIPENTTRFFVNFLCGESESSDIAFHLNPRFDGWDKVVFNSCQGGFWEAEEKIHRMPFHRGRVFEMVITATSHGYQVRVDGNEFHHFKHRVPMERVRWMHIAGDIRIETINVIGGGPAAVMGGGMGGGYPGGMDAGMGMGGMGMGMGGMAGGYPDGGMGGGYPGGMGGGMGGGFPGAVMGGDYPGCNLPMMSGQPIFHPTVPYIITIPQGMIHKRTVIIRGMVPFGGNRMSISFIVSRSRDIAFYLNHRVREGILVRNSMLGGSWGMEETEMCMNPFMEGQYFDISIRTGRHKFKVFVNGQPLFDFRHRFHHFHEIDTLEIDGDVQLSYVHI